MVGTSGVRWRKICQDDSVRLVIGRPRRIPRRNREDLAVVLAQELVGDRDVVDRRRHAARYGAFHVLLGVLKETSEWAALRDISIKSDVLATLTLRSLTNLTLDVLDRSIALPTEAPGGKAFGGLVALTVLGWQQRSVGREEVLRGVEEFDASDLGGEGREAVRSVLRSHLTRVVEEMRTYEEMLSMMKQMLPTGGDEVTVEEVFMAYLMRIDRFSELLRRSQELQRIIDLMGRLDVEYGATKDTARSFATSEAYALSRSKDIQHTLPVEIIKLKVPILRTLFFSQMLEGQLLTYELRGLNWSVEPESKRGPVVALIDASGSMSGEPELIAKAFILMLARRMERERRDVKIILFAAEDWKLDLNLTDKKEVAQSLLDTVCRHFEGGTDFNSALRVGLETLQGKQWKGADVLFFTDGESKVSDQELVREWSEFKRRTRSRIFTLIVGSDQTGGLERVSDQVWTLPLGTWDVEGSPAKIVKLMANGQT